MKEQPTVLDKYEVGDIVITKDNFCYLITSITDATDSDILYEGKSVIAGFLSNLIDDILLSEIVAKIGEYHE